MRINKYLRFATLSLALLLPLGAVAQESSINTYSPYTMYGLGNMNYTGSTSFAAMGGTSIGFRNTVTDPIGYLKVNTTNPASLSGLPQKSLILDMGFSDTNIYLMQRIGGNTLRTSYNTFNVNNITVAIPIAAKLGFAVNVSPYSKVGYKMHMDDHSYLADLGIVRYYYDGEGNITEAKIGVGWEPFKGLSIGAEVIYMWGTIDRYYQAQIVPYTGSGEYEPLEADTSESVSRIFGGFGLQYTALDKNKSRLTLGLTYRLGGKLNSKQKDYIPSNNIYGDIVRLNELGLATCIPQSIGAGVFFHRPKFAAGFDYIYQNWADKNSYDEINEVGYVNTSAFKFGAQFTPDRYNIRSFMKRLTYRVGFRHNDYYLQFRGRKMTEQAITFGVEIPFKMMTVSSVNVGFEFGQRGTLSRELMRERYFKVNVGILLFGRDYDYWFEKYRYN